jgi:hypothetical protein
MLSSLRSRRIYLLFVIILLFPLLKVEAAQTAAGRLGAAKARKGSAAPDTSEAPKPQLLNADSNPTLRYPVSVDENSSISCGWLDVTRSGVTYTVVESGNKGKTFSGKKFMAPGGAQYLVAPAESTGSEGFDIRLSEIQDIRLLEGSFLRIAFGGRKPLLIYVPQDYWGAVAGKPRAFKEFSQRDMAGTMGVQRGMQNFDTVLAEIKPPAPPTLDVSLHAESMSVEKGHPVTLVWNSTNATTLDLEPGVGRVAAAGGMSLVPQGSTNYTLTATGPAGTKAASVFVTVTQPAPTVPPTIVLIEPSAAGEGQTVEVASSPLIIRGVVMDASGIPVVTINGKSVTMRPTSAQAAQFRSDPIDLQPGENRFEVSAVNSARGQAKVAFVARLTSSLPKAPPAQPSNSRGLAKGEILSLLQGDVPSARVADLVKERGVKFVPTADDLKEIRGAGGGDDLIDAINQASSPARN